MNIYGAISKYCQHSLNLSHLITEPVVALNTLMHALAEKLSGQKS